MSILGDIKKVMPLPEDCTDFDTALIMHINSAFFNLKQLGIGPKTAFKITGDSNEWSEFECTEEQLEPVKEYVGLKTKKKFDPPVSSTAVTALNESIIEVENRLLWNGDYGT